MDKMASLRATLTLALGVMALAEDLDQAIGSCGSNCLDKAVNNKNTCNRSDDECICNDSSLRNDYSDCIFDRCQNDLSQAQGSMISFCVMVAVAQTTSQSYSSVSSTTSTSASSSSSSNSESGDSSGDSLDDGSHHTVIINASSTFTLSNSHDQVTSTVHASPPDPPTAPVAPSPPTTSTEATSSSSSRNSPSSPITSSVATSTSTSTSTATSNSSSSTNPFLDPAISTKAAIAISITIGALLLLGGIGFLGFRLRKRAKRVPIQSRWEKPELEDAREPRAELHGGYRNTDMYPIHEMPAERPPAELSSDPPARKNIGPDVLTILSRPDEDVM
ncbi:hypothetical protein F5B20DRAFT_532979, partial [Whalleya microplaca]